MKNLVVGCWLLVVGALAAGVARAAELPAGYMAIDAIVVPRGVYIDTGYKPNQNTRVVMDVTVQGAGEYWFGCWDRDYNDGAFAFCNDGNSIYAGYGNQGGAVGSVVANGRRTVELDKDVVKVDGVPVHAFNAATFALANNLYLFAQNRKGTVGVHGSQSTIICHGCKIYEGKALKRDFVPCTSPTEQTGLYDLVRQRFYALHLPDLPSGYTAVDFIESSKGGGQFIDTGYTANAQTKVVFEAFVPVRGEQEDQYGVLFGSRTMNDWTANAFALQMCKGNSGTDTVRFTYNGADRQDASKPFSYGERVTVTCDGQHIEWTGSKAASVAFTADALDHSKSTLYIFADNSVENGEKSKTGTNPSVMRLYSFKITEGWELKRIFVPCIRTADAVAGLYDMVERKFYENAGTGVFSTPLPFARELTSGTYEINESFVFAAPKLESALKIAEGATVTLKIAAGVTVALRGGDAFEVWGAGAGIEVPANATLKVTGDGKLNVYGGKGANGCNGVNGGYGSSNAEGTFTSGAGGAGGWGGGGAGAGIGGRGGNGGGGGNGGKAVTSYNWEHTDLDGYSGDNGGAGKNGGMCGTVLIEGTVKVVATGGSSGDADGAGGASGGWAWRIETYTFGAFGGGGGGGGAKGGAAADIGGGGAGGYGGGGGGSGVYQYNWYTSTLTAYPGWGLGGKGANDGATRTGKIYEPYETTIASGSADGAQRGSGGAAGAAGSRGGCGSITVAEFAVVASSSGESDSYSVGWISPTEYIRWCGNGLYRIKEGSSPEQISFSYVTKDTGAFSDGKWYVVKGEVSRGTIQVSGEANLVLLRDSLLTASGASASTYPGIWIDKGNTLNVFGDESGQLTAHSNSWRTPGIGSWCQTIAYYGSPGTLILYGGSVLGYGGQWNAGVEGDNIVVEGGKLVGHYGGSNQSEMSAIYASGSVYINGGELQAGCCYWLGHEKAAINPFPQEAERVIEFSTGNYKAGVGITFAVPDGLVLVSMTVDNGPMKKVTSDGNITVYVLPGSRLSLNFTVADQSFRLLSEASVCVPPYRRDVHLTAGELPRVEKVEPMPVVEYVAEDGRSARAENVFPMPSVDARAAMTSAWFVVTGAVTTADIDVKGEVNLILADGASLNVGGTLHIHKGASLKVFGQTANTGRLVADAIVTDDYWGLAFYGGVFGMDIREEWLGFGCYPIPRGDPDWPFAVKRGAAVVVGEFERMCVRWTCGDGSVTNVMTRRDQSFAFPAGSENVRVFYEPEPDCWLDGVASCDLGTVSEDLILTPDQYPVSRRKLVVEYLDKDGNICSNDIYYVVTDKTAELTDGHWYVVRDEVWRNTSIRVDGTAHLILTDGCELSVSGEKNELASAGIIVTVGNELTIYGQREGTGHLIAKGGRKFDSDGVFYGAGIGGYFWGDTHFQRGGDIYEQCGTVRVNGGTVTASGGAASIGCQFYEDFAETVEGRIEINGGTVEATMKNVDTNCIAACEVVLGERVEIVEGGFDTWYMKIVEKQSTCTGGTIAKVGVGEWVVTPNAGVTEITIANLPPSAVVAVPPTVTQVGGVADSQIKVKSGAYDITGAFSVAGGAIALDENGSVTIGGETIPVKPVIGDWDEGEAFVVGEGNVTVTVRAIPGLTYSLVRGAELGAITMTVVEPILATEAQMTLTDADPPAGAAFYKVVVSVP